MTILGCWYSHNLIHDKFIRSSLDSIEKARVLTTKASVEVRTCTWQPILGSPFGGTLTHYQLPFHLGIVIQILRALYEAEAEGVQFDVVSFLEHDVLYPEDYFDRVYDAFSQRSDVKGVSNLDYIGMNETGWLGVDCRHEPMHQLSLSGSFALEHFESVYKRLVVETVVCVEPDDKEEFVRIPFSGDRPACHMNHSAHFTNHFIIYSRTSDQVVHPYWGDYRQYYPVGDEQSIQDW